ncbi:MAG: TRAP transporter substrate-binding protein DctP [Candidatus Thioglobus sp.]|jgi:TRAP-type mannitol/chloroaromatic compound transport system substrate-binding protein|nr:TRAP transporter substrate-binding protein DctP [Candidatus Pseudothioglobus aerophilus]|tara:strand:- start:611 stop:1681 length:1071 start_codon:yes stop_codon:yes gene_type:complete
MNKNKFLLTLMATILVFTGSNTFAEEKVVKWKLAMHWPQTLAPFAWTVLRFSENVEEMSGGRMTIRVDDSNKHKAAAGILDMVGDGQYEMGHTASYYWKGKDINTMPFTTMPFGMTTAEQDAWYYYGGGEALAQEVFSKHNVISHQGGSTGNQMGGWFRKEINSAEDLKGLKMRIPGFAGEVMSELGVAVTNLPAGELYTALERGTIDALEWVGPGMDINMGFHKVAPYYYTGWHEPATDLQFLINQDAWDELPADLQAIVKSAIIVSKSSMYWENYAMSSEAWSKMGVDYPNIKVKSFPPELVAQMKAANAKLIAETSAKDPMFKKIIDSQSEFMAKAREWTKISDYLYLKDNID